MNRIETKIVIMVTNRLAAANDSDAKIEMIEELSENLYQRYLELAEGGTAEEEALKQAMESLGDADELIDFLREAEKDNGKTSADGKEVSAEGERTASFSMDDFGKEIEEIVSAALATAKGAVDCAKEAAKDVTSQLKEKYPDGVFMQFSKQRGKKVECTAIPAEDVNSLEINMEYGDICIGGADEEEAFIEVSGDMKNVETTLAENGLLYINRRKTASSSFMHMRGICNSAIEVRLPEKAWDNITITTPSGSVDIDDELECRELKIRTASGGIMVDGILGNLCAETASGDMEINGNPDKCELYSASGDISFDGEGRELNCSTSSGKIDMNLNRVPKKANFSLASGDCEVRVPLGEGFKLTYQTVSGEFLTNLPLSGTLSKKRGEAVFGNGEAGEIKISSASGDINVCAREQEAEEA